VIGVRRNALPVTAWRANLALACHQLERIEADLTV